MLRGHSADCVGLGLAARGTQGALEVHGLLPSAGELPEKFEYVSVAPASAEHVTGPGKSAPHEAANIRVSSKGSLMPSRCSFRTVSDHMKS
jgi:hypothetical protein